MSPASGERIHKTLAAAGHGSRRDIEAWIEAGRITVNGKLARIGQRLTGRERVYLDGRKLNLDSTTKHRHLMYYKPVGEVNSRRDEKGRKTVFTRLPSAGNARWISVGRLDITTQGLLIMTTDGELANRLMHPRYELDRRYAVRILGKLTAAQLQQLKTGVELDDGPANFKRIVAQRNEQARPNDAVNSWYQVTLQEGRNREVRRMFEAVGVTVSRLIRVGYGPLALDRRLVRGRFRALTPREAEQLYAAVGMGRDGKRSRKADKSKAGERKKQSKTKTKSRPAAKASSRPDRGRKTAKHKPSRNGGQASGRGRARSSKDASS